MASEDCEALLDRALVGRVGTCGPGGVPYVVPMSFAYDAASRTVFLHCATSGHLLRNLAANPLACFEVDEAGDVIATGRYGCDTSQVYSSVICFGRARVLEATDQKRAALGALVKKYVDGLMPDRAYDPELVTIDATAAIALRVETMTGKQRRAS